MSVIQVNGTQLHYVEEGQGPPVILIHGGIGDFRAGQAQMKPFAQHYRTIAYSRRYHYPNPWPDDGSNEAGLLHVEDLAALINALGLGRVHLVGGSYGAYISLLLAVRQPELVASLVLGEPGVIPLLEQSEEGKTLWAEFLANAIEPAQQAFRQGQLQEGVRYFVNGVIGPGTFEQIPSEAIPEVMENALELKAQLMASHDVTYPLLSCAEMRQMTVPTLLLTGELSPRMFHVITDEIERCLPHSERVMLLGVSHGLRANIDAYNTTVLAFLAQHARD